MGVGGRVKKGGDDRGKNIKNIFNLICAYTIEQTTRGRCLGCL